MTVICVASQFRNEFKLFPVSSARKPNGTCTGSIPVMTPTLCMQVHKTSNGVALFDSAMNYNYCGREVAGITDVLFPLNGTYAEDPFCSYGLHLVMYIMHDYV